VNLNRGLLVQIIPVHGNVDDAARDLFCPNVTESFGQSTREVYPATLDADDDDFLVSFIPFGNFSGHALNRALNDSGGKKLFGFGHWKKKSPLECLAR
jgi:hypothetical protein